VLENELADRHDVDHAALAGVKQSERFLRRETLQGFELQLHSLDRLLKVCFQAQELAQTPLNLDVDGFGWVGHPLTCCGPEEWTRLRQDQLAKVGHLEAALLDTGGLKTDLNLGLVPIANDVMTGLYRVIGMLCKAIDVIKDVARFESRSVSCHPLKSLARLKQVHASQLSPLSFNLEFLLGHIDEQLIKFLIHSGSR